MRHKIEIAFRRKIRAVWLDQGMALAARNVPWLDAKPALAAAVAIENPGLETIRKVLEHIRRIWFEPPDNCIALRSGALRLLNEQYSRDVCLLLNWGMATAVYPFVGDVAETLGRLLKLQGDVRRTDVLRRLREQHGDRDFVNRISRYNISSFLDWGVIAEVKRGRGIYIAGRKIRLKRPEHLAWLAEAVLTSRDESQMALSKLRNHPGLFVFALDALNIVTLRNNACLHVARQSINEDFVSVLRRSSQEKANAARYS